MSDNRRTHRINVEDLSAEDLARLIETFSNVGLPLDIKVFHIVQERDDSTHIHHNI